MMKPPPRSLDVALDGRHLRRADEGLRHVAEDDEIVGAELARRRRQTVAGAHVDIDALALQRVRQIGRRRRLALDVEHARLALDGDRGDRGVVRRLRVVQRLLAGGADGGLEGREAGLRHLRLPAHRVRAGGERHRLPPFERIDVLVAVQRHRDVLRARAVDLGGHAERRADLDVARQRQRAHEHLVVGGARVAHRRHTHAAPRRLGRLGDDVAFGLVAVGDEDGARQSARRIEPVGQRQRRGKIAALDVVAPERVLRAAACRRAVARRGADGRRT